MYSFTGQKVLKLLDFFDSNPYFLHEVPPSSLPAYTLPSKRSVASPPKLGTFNLPQKKGAVVRTLVNLSIKVNDLMLASEFRRAECF